MNGEQELERRLRTALQAGGLPSAPASLHEALDRVADLPRQRPGRRAGPIGIVRALAVAAVLVVGGAVALSVGSGRFDPPATHALSSASPAAAESSEAVRRITFRPEWTATTPGSADRLEAIVEVVRGRLEALELEPVVSSDDVGDVIVGVPESADVATVRRVASQVGFVEFVPLGDRSATPGERLDDTEFPALFGSEAVTSSAMTEEQAGLPSITMTLRDEEAAAFGAFTEDNIGSFFAITIDRVVMFAPSITEAIPGGEIAISPGGPDTDSFAEIAAIAANGPLPVPLVEVGAETVAPGASTPAIGYDVRCGPLEPSQCLARAAAMVAGIGAESPSKTVVLVEFLADGDTRVVFEDGTGVLGIRD